MRRIRLGLSLLIALALFASALFSFLSFMVVDGPSMEPGYPDGLILAVNRVAYGFRLPSGYLLRWAEPRAGDLVVFRNPLDGKLSVKRCLAVAGDPLLPGEGGLAVGGRVLPLDPSQAFHYMDPSSVPPGCVFVAGDNHRESADSRDYGCLPIEKIIGKVLVSPWRG